MPEPLQIGCCYFEQSPETKSPVNVYLSTAEAEDIADTVKELERGPAHPRWVAYPEGEEHPPYIYATSVVEAEQLDEVIAWLQEAAKVMRKEKEKLDDDAPG
jgi:hypothetical protein